MPISCTSRRGIPRTAEPLRLAFPTTSTTKLRIEGTELEIMQLGEVEAYAIQPAAYPAPTGATLPSLLEAGDYPGAAERARGAFVVAAALTALAVAATPSVAAPAAAPGNGQDVAALLPAGAFKPLGGATDPAAHRAARALGLPVAEVTTKARAVTALAGVTCVVTGSAPHPADAGNTRINTTVTVNCNSAIRLITISIWLLHSLDDVNFTTLSNRLNERSAGNLFSVGTTGDIQVCLPQYYIGLAHVWVQFLDGTPLEDGGWFGTDSVFIGCG